MEINQKENTHFKSIMFAIFFGVFLGTFNTSTVNVALPTFMKFFNTNLDSVKWILTGFILATGTACPLAGYLGEKFSYKKLYLFALIGFTLSSVLCAFSFNIVMLITCRVIQGIFSGLIMPATMTIIYQVIPRKKQALAASLWSMSSMLAPAVAPTLSGWLIQSFSWRAIFLINVPISIIAIVMVILFIPQYNLSHSNSFDYIGLLVIITLSLSILIAFSEGSIWGWTSLKTISLIILGILSLIIFILRELKVTCPALNIRVFKFRKYTLSVVLLSLVTLSLYVGTLLTPLFLQNAQHLSALDTGLILLLPSLAMALVMPLVGTLSSRIDARILIALGISFLALGSWKLSSLTLTTPHYYVISWMIIRYVGISFSTMPITNLGLSIIPRNLSGHASSIINWVRQVSSSLAIGIFSSLLLVRTTYHSKILNSGNTAQNLIQVKAYTMGINDLFFAATLIVLIALPLSFMLKKETGNKKSLSDQEVA